MRRRRLATVLAIALLLLTASLTGPSGARAEEKSFSLQDLDTRQSRGVVEPMRGYLDPSIEFLWRHRKAVMAAFQTLEETHGAQPLKDIGLLRSIVYQGRHFEPRFSEKKVAASRCSFPLWTAAASAWPGRPSASVRVLWKRRCRTPKRESNSAVL